MLLWRFVFLFLFFCFGLPSFLFIAWRFFALAFLGFLLFAEF